MHVEWYNNTLTIKHTILFKTFALYISQNLLLWISYDHRYYNIHKFYLYYNIYNLWLSHSHIFIFYWVCVTINSKQLVDSTTFLNSTKNSIH